jgi:hypothetical protein
MNLYSGQDPLQVQESEYPYSPMFAIGLLFWVLIVYLGLRQAGHALGVFLAGGSAAGLDRLFISTLEIAGNPTALTRLQISLRSLGGMLLPLLAWAGFMLPANRRGTSAVEAFKLVSSVGALGGLIGWILVPLGYRPGLSPASEDVSLFLQASGWNGTLTAGLCLLVFAGGYMLARRRIFYLGALRDMLQGRADDLDYQSNRAFYLGIGGVFVLVITASLVLRLLRG